MKTRVKLIFMAEAKKKNDAIVRVRMCVCMRVGGEGFRVCGLYIKEGEVTHQLGFEITDLSFDNRYHLAGR